MAAPEQIRSISWLAQDPTLSLTAEQAARLPANRGSAEEVLQQAPDIVFAGPAGTQPAAALLERFGAQVEHFPVPTTLAQVRAQIQRAALLLKQTDNGEALLGQLDAAVAAPQRRDRPLSAAIYQPNGLTLGHGSLLDELLTAAGLSNFATAHGLQSYQYLPVEVLLAAKVDLLVISSARHATPSLAHEKLQHPLLRRWFAGRTVLLPPQSWTCGTQGLVQAMQILKDAADERANQVPEA